MKVKLNSMIIEIDKGINFGINYYLKINEMNVGESDPHIFSYGEKEVSSPEVQEIHKFLYPLTGVFFQPRQKIIGSTTNEYSYDKDNPPSFFPLGSVPSFSEYASVRQTFVYKCTIKNTVSAPMVIQSVILPPAAIGFSLSLSGGLESLSTDFLVPDFEMYNTTANLIGAPFGYIMDYIYVIPEDTSFDFYLFIEDECHLRTNIYSYSVKPS